MTSGFFTGDVLRGLAVRVLFFLTLTLLPIGIVSVSQTRQIAEQSRVNGELSLLAVTERTSAAEQDVLSEAFGAADALGSIIAHRHKNVDECSALMAEYKQTVGIYSLVGFISADGVMECSSLGGRVDHADDPSFRKAMETGVRRATTIQSGQATGRPVTLVHVPIIEAGQILGVMAISIPYSTFDRIAETGLPLKPLAMFTFNQDGHLLTSEKHLTQVHTEVPRDVALVALKSEDARVFFALNEDGVRRAYAVLPLVPDTVFAMSVWPSDTPILKSDVPTLLNMFLPIAMWVASLVVAFWALNRLAIKHIRKLGRQMRRFAKNRMLPRDTLAPSVPSELVQMERNFIEMAESILRDEATLEDSLREKNILLKEVHHRVKNNLQLISSIMNMQIRQAQGDDAKFVLRRLQERILSLATVHENLYRDDSLVRVDASVLLQSSVNQLLAVGLVRSSGIKVSQSYDSVTLDPDDAAPLTLLVSEAVTNALKYVSTEHDGQGHINIVLTQPDPTTAQLVIENTAPEEPPEQGTGLGTKLIIAFTRQLNGEVAVETPEGLYRLTVTFPVPQSEKPTYDY